MGAVTVNRWLPPIRPSSSSSPSSSWYPDNFVVDPDVVDDHIAGTDVGPLVKDDADRCTFPVTLLSQPGKALNGVSNLISHQPVCVSWVFFPCTQPRKQVTPSPDTPLNRGEPAPQ